MKKIVLTLFIIAFSMQLMVAQNLKRANHLFEKRAYLEAADLFLKEDSNSQKIQENLGDCYYFNSKMKDASFWYQKLISNYENNIDPIYFYRYAQSLKGISQFSEADKWQKKYNDKKEFASSNETTIAFFDSLNSEIDRPYIIHKTAINSENSDFGLSMFGDKVVFASSKNNGVLYDWNKQPYLDLFIAEIDKEGELINKIPFSNSINTKTHESNAVFTKDGKTMYFTRNNFKAGKKTRDANKVMHLKIFKAELVNNEWIHVIELPFNSDNYSVEHPALSPDEKQLYFSSDMPGSIGSFDIFVVAINLNGSYGTPKNLGPIINTEHREQFPFISSSNNLYFSSDGHFGLGGLDIFKSEIVNGNFSKPKNLSDKINSNLDDFSFIINEEDETGYFSSNRLGGIGDDDIYRFTRVKKYYVKGLVKDKNTLELLPNSKVTLLETDNTLLDELTVGKNADYSFNIQPNSSYKIRGSRKLYTPYEIEFKTDEKGNINKNIMLLMELYQDVEKEIVVENGKTQIKINPIYFDFNKWNIRPDAALELQNIVSIMNKYPEMTIEIGAHTDFRGSDNYNLVLSEKRAAAVREYLVSQGISTSNVKSVGYGESQPVNKCVKEGICKNEEYELNRRCEFVILN